MSGWKIEAGGWPVASERRLAAGFGHSDIKGVWSVKAGQRPALHPPVAAPRIRWTGTDSVNRVKTGNKMRRKDRQTIIVSFICL